MLPSWATVDLFDYDDKKNAELLELLLQDLEILLFKMQIYLFL